ncbi:MAG: hypothetical protein ACI4VF_09820, partial [Lachnospirales bacterium]
IFDKYCIWGGRFMLVSKETRNLNIICIFLVVIAGVIRLIAKQVVGFSYNGIIFVLFMAAGNIWIFQLQKRLLQKNVRRNLILTAFLMIFWMMIRTIKYDFIPMGNFLARYIWYFYYLPMLFIPLLMFLSVLEIGRVYNKPICKKWYVLFIPTFFIFFGILTNDIHQKAFYFNDGLNFWNDDNVSRGFIYYMAIIWIFFLFISIIVVVFKRCKVPKRFKMIWVPLCPLLIGLIYIILVVLDINSIFTKILLAPEIGCFIFASFMESLICVRLFPTNDNYGDFWNSSSIGAGIMNNEGVICYKSEKSIPVTFDSVKKAEREDVFFNKGNSRLKSHKLNGGYGYWIRDISEIKKLNDKLKKIGEITAKENSILEAENKVEEERLRIKEQNMLYDKMAKGVKKQLDILNHLYYYLPDNEDDFEKNIKYACILYSYIKRHSNLFLLSNESDFIDSDELKCAFIESIEYLKLCNIKAQCVFEGRRELNGDIVLYIFEVYEDILENSIPGADNILIYINILENSLIMQVEINKPKNIFSDKSNNKFGTFEIETEDNTEYITLTLMLGGKSNDSLL